MKKILVIIGSILVLSFWLGSTADNYNTDSTQQINPAPVVNFDSNSNQPETVKQIIDSTSQKVDSVGIQATDSTVKKQEVSPTVNQPKPLEEVDYYKNSEGNTVQSPTLYDSRPSGASALCRDGTYSFSQNRRGTCSHHGGVAEWY